LVHRKDYAKLSAVGYGAVGIVRLSRAWDRLCRPGTTRLEGCSRIRAGRFSMKTTAITVLVATGGILGVAGIAWAAQTITATADVNGKPRAATAQIEGPSSIRCTSAAGQAGDGDKPSCRIVAPGYTGTVEIGKIVAADRDGQVTLTCNGRPPLRCTAEITP
jgi:hypothetical protein